MLQGKSAARHHIPDTSHRQSNRQTCWHEDSPTPRWQQRVFTCMQIDAGITFVGGCRKRQFGVETHHFYGDDAFRHGKTIRPRLLVVLVWMDLEMTGLDPDKDVIVEIATVVTDDELNLIEEGPNLVIHQPESVLTGMQQIVVDMHTKSGLLDLIRTSTLSVGEAEAQTLAFIRKHVPEARTIPLCGNSIGTDRRFLARYMPSIENHLHYRCVDVSTIKELAKRWYPSVTPDRPGKNGTHRALDDVRASVEELRFYRDKVFSANNPASPANPS